MSIAPLEYDMRSPSSSMLRSLEPASSSFSSSPCPSPTPSSHDFSFSSLATPSMSSASSPPHSSSLASILPASSASSSSSSSRLSRLVCVQTPLFSEFGANLWPFVGYPFLVQTRLFELGYHATVVGTVTYIFIAGWPISTMLRIFTAWMLVRALLNFGLHTYYSSLITYYQYPPKRLRLARQAIRLLTFVFMLASLLMSASEWTAELDDPDPSLWAAWSLLLSELSLVLCMLLVYGMLHLCFRSQELSSLFPFIKPTVFEALFPSSSSSDPPAIPGLSPSQLDRLPCCEYRVEMLPSLAEDGCVICQCSVNEGDAVRLLRCGHGFHRECVDQWLQRRSVCPLCVRVVRADRKLPKSHEQPEVELVVQQPAETAVSETVMTV